LGKEPNKELKLDDPRKIFIYTFFTTLTGITPIDYYETNETISFLITPADARKIREKTLDIVRMLSDEFKKKVDIIVYSENLEKFIQNLFKPAKVENVFSRSMKNGRKSLLVKVSPWDRGKALGKNSYKLYRARYFLSKYFDVEYVRII